ncbi:MAG: hypothetical protein AAGH48_10665 [Pseudomonadota bacterium]
MRSALFVLVAVLFAEGNSFESVAEDIIPREDPVAALRRAIADGSEFSFIIKNPEDIISATHGGHLPLPLRPSGMAELADPDLEPTLILSTKLRDDKGEVIGVATQTEYFDAIQTDGQSLTHTSWTLQVPHFGTLYLYTNEFIGPEFRKILREVTENEAHWSGRIQVQTSAGPSADGSGVIVGGVGEFAGVSGRFVELNTFTEYTPAGELTGVMELRVGFDVSEQK